MTKQEIIYDIITIATKGGYTDDQKLDEDYLGYKIDEKRAKEIRDTYKRNTLIDPVWIQDLGTINTTIVNQADDKQYNYLNGKLAKFTLPPVVSIISPLASANNLGVQSIRSINSHREFYFMHTSQLLNVAELSPNHVAKRFGFYTKIGDSYYIPNGPDNIRAMAILEKPLEGFVNSSENIPSGNLIIGVSYIVMSEMIIHNGIAYIKNNTFVAVNTTFTGSGKVQLVNQKRPMTVEDNYPMSFTMCEVVIMKILTQELQLEQQQVADIKNNSKDSLFVNQQQNE